MAPLAAINSQFRTKAKTPRFFTEGSVASFPAHHLLTVRTWHLSWFGKNPNQHPSKKQHGTQKNEALEDDFPFQRVFVFKGVIFLVPCEFSRKYILQTSFDLFACVEFTMAAMCYHL